MRRELERGRFVYTLLVLLCSLFLACEDEASSVALPIDGGDGGEPCDAACELKKLCGNNVFDEDKGEVCDVVYSVPRFGSGVSCEMFVPESVGSLFCTSDCVIDSSACEKEILHECNEGDYECEVVNVGGKESNALRTCVEGRWSELETCEGSCLAGECVECQSWDFVCNPPICTGENEVVCRGKCCDLREAFCDYEGIGDCCTYENVCGTKCCGAGEVCENAVCRKECANARCVGTDGQEFCCENAGELCISNQCFEPKLSCVDSYTCENTEYCDSLLKQCLPHPKTEPACLRKISGGEVVPTLLWHWGKNDVVIEDCPANKRVMSTPMVADLDKDGFPEIIFNSYSTSDHGTGVIRVLDGRDGTAKFTIMDEANSCTLTVGGAQTAIGDLNGDGYPDIVTCAAGTNDLIAFDHEGKKLWQSGRILNGVDIGAFCGQSGPGIADFDGDGKPEVYVSYTLVNGQTGEIKWHNKCETGSTTGPLYYHHACEYSVAADLDGDGTPELVGGNVAWKADGTEFYRVSDMTDGYPAVADVNLDGKPEIAVVEFKAHSLVLLNNEGQIQWRSDANADIPEAGEIPGGGPPNIANIDDDPNPEITFAGGYAYQAFKHDGRRMWHKRTKDFSSKKTGSSIFDFNGDGTAEAVYADEEWLRVYDGKTGDTVFCMPNTSATHWEYPVIADVNADGAAEIVVCSNPGATNVKLPINNGRDECVSKIIGPDPENPAILQTDPIVASTSGVRVFAAPNKDWVGTRKIWNQHAYSVTNVSDDGTIPQKARPNWLVHSLNNFRLNVEPSAINLPDLSVENISSSTFLCKPTVELLFDVTNKGWASIGAGVPIQIFITQANGTRKLIADLKTTSILLPGSSEPMSFNYTKEESDPQPLVIDIEIDGERIELECNSDNNTGVYNYSCQTQVN